MDFASLYPTPARAVQSLRDVPNLLTKLPPQDWKCLTRWPRQIERLERYHGVACWDHVFGQVSLAYCDNWATLARCHTTEDVMWFISSPMRWRALLWCATSRQIERNIDRLLSREIAPLLTPTQIEDLEYSASEHYPPYRRAFVDSGRVLSIKLARAFSWCPPAFHPHLSWRHHLAYAAEYRRHVVMPCNSSFIEIWPAQVFWMSVYLNAGFLELIVGPWLIVRFFRIINLLPVELQLLICNQVYNSLDDTISSDLLRYGRCLLNVEIHAEKNDSEDEVDLRGFE